jgi:hypothetical protein
MEEWKFAIENYEVSNFGNIRKNGKSIKGSITNRGGGYKYLQLQRDGKRKNILFHHLVAKLFIGERPQGMVIDHIDRNSLNNNVNNLRYITQLENSHNTSIYRTDILTSDKQVRKNIMSRERDRRTGRFKNLRNAKGLGSIKQRQNGRYKLTITINGVKHIQTFNTVEEAEDFRNNLLKNEDIYKES